MAEGGGDEDEDGNRQRRGAISMTFSHRTLKVLVPQKLSALVLRKRNMDDDILNRKKWWPDEDNVTSSSSTAIIAGTNLPSGVSSLPFVSCLNLRRCFQSRPIQSVLKVCLSKLSSK